MSLVFTFTKRPEVHVAKTTASHMACAPFVNLVERKFESEAGEPAERKLPSSII